MKKNLWNFIRAPFLGRKRTSGSLIFIFILINGIVATNAVLHDPTIGYDSKDHLLYVEVLSEFRLPSPEDTHQFFSPPLPYLLPAIASMFGLFPYMWIWKFSQLLNVIYSIGLTFYLLKICDLTIRKNGSFKLSVLSLLGMLPVYYKTFAFIRGEPLLAFLFVFSTYQALCLFLKQDFTPKRVCALGISMGLTVLARQWGFALFPGLIIFVGIVYIKEKNMKTACIKYLVSTLAISFLIGGWFYLRHHHKFGSIRAFNRSGTHQFSFTNQPNDFYMDLGLDKLFNDPIRKSFTNQFFPKFYSEFWGDHECYFLVYGWNHLKKAYLSGWMLEQQLDMGFDPTLFKTNRYKMASYLGRVNLVSLIPTIVFVSGFVWGFISFIRLFLFAAPSPSQYAGSFIFLLVLISWLGYSWFLIAYPNLEKGDTIKATYMLQTFPFLAYFGGMLLESIKNKSKIAFNGIWVVLALVTLHNLPAFFTRFIVSSQ